MAKIKYDFSGYATKNNIRCGDGRIIHKDAFKHQDGEIVSLVWQHLHDDPTNILGHALLENREDGVYAYGKFNNSEKGLAAKEAVKHGDIKFLSIYANKLKQNGSAVIHGMLGEVSLVFRGANPGALIENLSIEHSDGFSDTLDDEAIIKMGIPFSPEDIIHGDDDVNINNTNSEAFSNGITKEMFASMMNDYLTHKSTDNKTIQEVIDSMTDEQKTVMHALIAEALADDEKIEETLAQSDLEEGEIRMKKNIFDGTQKKDDDNKSLMHADTEAAIFNDFNAKKYNGSLRDTVLAHGVEDIEYLFPEARNVTNTPSFIQRDMAWVGKVMNSVHNTPFSRVKSIFANLTEDDARARGYITGNMKTEEFFSLMKRTTSPQTVYKKQRLDRDDIIDIVDFDVVAWIKSEMRTMLDEELARAFLVGDGRLGSSDEKIQESNIRPIWTDADLYTIKTQVPVSPTATDSEKARAFIRAAVKSRKQYKGSGNPSLFASEDIITDCLLLEDLNQRVIYDTIDKLATALRVKEIISVPVMEGLARSVAGTTYPLLGIIVNLQDYNVGADKGGSVNMFEDFDIDFNAEKYLIETRCSGALIKPYSAIVLEAVVSAG